MKKIIVDKVPSSNTLVPYAKIGEGPKNLVVFPELSIRPVTPMAETVAKQFAAIPDEYTIWLFDRPENLPVGSNFETITETTVCAMWRLGIRSCAVFGASHGGMLAMYLAALYPEIVEKLILGSTTSHITDDFRGRVADWRKMAEAKEHRRLAESFVDWMYGEKTLCQNRDTLLVELPEYSDYELERFCILLETFETSALEKQPSRITCPTLVIVSQGDRIFGPEPGRKIAEETKGAIHEYGPEYGHAVYNEAPDYAECIAKFLEAQNE